MSDTDYKADVMQNIVTQLSRFPRNEAGNVKYQVTYYNVNKTVEAYISLDKKNNVTLQEVGKKHKPVNYGDLAVDILLQIVQEVSMLSETAPVIEEDSETAEWEKLNLVMTLASYEMDNELAGRLIITKEGGLHYVSHVSPDDTFSTITAYDPLNSEAMRLAATDLRLLGNVFMASAEELEKTIKDEVVTENTQEEQDS